MLMSVLKRLTSFCSAWTGTLMKIRRTSTQRGMRPLTGVSRRSSVVRPRSLMGVRRTLKYALRSPLFVSDLSLARAR